MTYEKYLSLLQSYSYDHGTRIAIHSANSADYVYIVRACWELELTPVNINIHLPSETVLDILNMTNTKLIFSMYQNYDYNIESIIIKQDDNNKISVPKYTGNLENEGSIIFTSGSTGAPKGIVHTIANHYYSALGSNENIEFTKDDCWLAALPFYHISGFSLIMRASINGGCLMISDKITNDITHISLVPSQLIKYLENNKSLKTLKNMKVILLGGDATPKSLVDKARKEKLSLFITYGSSEMASQVTTTINLKNLTENYYTSGKLLKYRELKIDKYGRVFVKGKTLFNAYLNQETCLNADGWFDTGDMGKLDSNKNLIIKGRGDSMFISGGLNIYPKEIENIILELDAIESCIVVPIDDEIYGKTPIAFIKTNENLAEFANVIKEYLSDKLEKYKIPKTFLSADSAD